MAYQAIAAHRWGGEWNPDPIRHVHNRLIGALKASIPVLARWSPRRFERVSVDRYFDLTASHFLSRAAPNWGFPLTETQATRGLTHSVMAHHRPARIKALLAGLGIEATEDALADAIVVAEEARVDLLVVWDMERKGAVIEAKFGHKVTPGQLGTYGQYIRKTYPKMKPDWIVLKLDAEEWVPFKGRQSTTWSVASWAALLMQMERALPAEADDDDFRLFRRMLWQRINGLQQGRR